MTPDADFARIKVDELIRSALGTSTDGGGDAPPPIDLPPNRPDNGGMEDRLRKVEDAIIRIDATLPHLATKADLADVKTEIANVRAEIARAVTALTWRIPAMIGFLVLIAAVARRFLG